MDKLIGPPRKDVVDAIREEHYAVPEGEFGASDEKLESPNYQVLFTPRQEYNFVMEPTFDRHTQMSAGKDQTTGEALPDREHIVLKDLLTQAVERMRGVFKEMKLSEDAITPELFAELQFTLPELGSLRMYTGPMFMLYNTVLRAMATKSKTVEYGGPSMLGKSVEKKFTTTLHGINSGVIKLSRMQPACEVYRGVGGMRLPPAFVTPNSHNVRGGVENGFLSTTTDWDAALKYGRAAKDGEASLIFRMRMARMFLKHGRGLVF